MKFNEDARILRHLDRTKLKKMLDLRRHSSALEGNQLRIYLHEENSRVGYMREAAYMGLASIGSLATVAAGIAPYTSELVRNYIPRNVENLVVPGLLTIAALSGVAIVAKVLQSRKITNDFKQESRDALQNKAIFLARESERRAA